MRYKVGDRVVIRKNLVSGWYYHYENSMGRLFLTATCINFVEKFV